MARPATQAFALALWVALLIGCAPSGPELPRLPHEAVILAFGDSLTYGTGADRGESYPAVLAKLSGRNVINAGVPGELSTAGRMRLPQLLDRHAPDLLILCHGGNDILRSIDQTQTLANLRAMVGAARDRGIPVVLLGVPEKSWLLETAEVYRELAEEFDIPLEEEVLAQVIGDRELKSDRIHPNGRGYRTIAEAVYDLLRERGAL